MAEPKKVVSISAALVAALAVGHVSGRNAVSVPPVAAHASAIRFAPDGRIGVDIHLSVGSANGHHIVNCDADGSAPVIDGQPSVDVHASSLCVTSAKAEQSVIADVTALADSLATVPSSKSK